VGRGVGRWVGGHVEETVDVELPSEHTNCTE
jgi:hypothetical protein